MKTYYIYAHYTLDTDECFYIGVGTGRRAYKKGLGNRNSYHTKIIDKHGYRVEIIKDGYVDRNKAVDDEVMLQLFFKPRACFSYGDGVKKITTEETRTKLSIISKGKNNAFYGKKHTEEIIAKLKLVENKPIINCRGQVFSSSEEAAIAFKLKGGGNIRKVVKNISKYKTAGKYSDGTRVKWSYFTNT